MPSRTPSLAAAPIPFRLPGMAVPPERFQSAEMAFFKALYSPACAGGAGADRVSNTASHRSARRGAKGAQVSRFLDERVESLPAARCPPSAKIGNQIDRLAHSPGKRPAELAGRFETRTAPMVTFGAGDTGAVVDLASG